MRPRLARGGARLCVCAGAILALGGCGSDTLTLAQLRLHAGHACTRAALAEHRIAAPVGPGGAGPFLREGILAVSAERRTLAALRPGGAAAAPYHRALDALRQELAALRSAAAELARGDDATATVRELQTLLAPLEREANLAFAQLAIPSCLTS